MPDRPSPNASATLYAEGTKKRGNDNNMWTVKITSNGVHRWQLIKPSRNFDSVNHSISKAPIIFDFEYFERIGEFDASSGLMYGEIIAKPLDIMLKGAYIAYNVDQMLLIAHQSVGEITPDILDTLKFKDSGMRISIDYGLQCFYDADCLKTISKYNNKIRKLKSANNVIPLIMGNIDDYDDGFVVNSTDIDNKLDRGSKKIDYTQVIEEFWPFGVVLNNGIGAGSFPLYTVGKKIAIIGDL
jgi:hypothetical protein